MRNFIRSIIIVAASSFATINANAQTQQTPHTINGLYKYVGPDIDLQGGVGYHWDTANSVRDATFGMSRLRAGIMYIPGYPWVFSAGPTFEINSTTLPVWGGQVEVLNFGAGLWLRGGVGLDYSTHPHYNAALGWSLVGVEVSGFSAGPWDNREGVSVLATLRIPVGFIMYVFDKHH